eukprot:686899-Hanusia_phi.AAC.14
MSLAAQPSLDIKPLSPQTRLVRLYEISAVRFSLLHNTLVSLRLGVRTAARQVTKASELRRVTSSRSSFPSICAKS